MIESGSPTKPAAPIDIGDRVSPTSSLRGDRNSKKVASSPARTAVLPPGQRALRRFPRFGTHLAQAAPAVPVDPVVTVRAPGMEPFDVPLANLAALPRKELHADFHCVAGWSTTNLRWEGVLFETFYRTTIEPALVPGTVITHVVFSGLDGYRSTLLFEDALDDRVLLAQRLDGLALGANHGAPLRLVSPSQYGYMSTKHLCDIEVRSGKPRSERRSFADRLLESHPRARVAHEERHGSLPGWLVRPFYRALKAPLLYLCARGEQQEP
jgi:DMSO/TMAO reductase YedYZ molybdopterin-dependent catalytic subunit